MFENLQEKLQRAFKNLRGQGTLTEENIQEALKEIRMALLEADVNFKVVKTFIDRVSAKAVGAEVMTALSPAQQVVKIVHDELVELLRLVAAPGEVVRTGDRQERPRLDPVGHGLAAVSEREHLWSGAFGIAAREREIREPVAHLRILRIRRADRLVGATRLIPLLLSDQTIAGDERGVHGRLT